MKGASEYIFVAGVATTFDALRKAVLERNLPVIEEDPRHLRLAFRLDQPAGAEVTKALCAVLDVGHGLSKMVVVCVDEMDGGVIAPESSLDGLFIQVEHTLHTAGGKRTAFALPPLTKVEPPSFTGVKHQLASWH
jgi:hypothetical protein